MTGRLDVSFMGKDARPIVVKTARRIEHDVRWRGVKGLAAALVVTALMLVGIACLWCMV